MTSLAACPEIAIGAGRLAGLGGDLRALIDRPVRVLVVLDPGLASDTRAVIERSLTDVRLTPVVYSSFTGEPHAAQIDTCAAVARDARVEAVVGVGGGTVLDVAKMIAAIATDDPGADYYQLCTHRFPPVPLPLVQVPTTAGTGSEATVTAIHTNAAGKKVWCWGAELRAQKIILDADLTASLPSRLAATTGLDALVHAIEAATNVNSSPYTRMYAHEAIRIVTAQLPIVVDGIDRGHTADVVADARQEMLWASCLAGIAINACGTAIGHIIAHALGTLGRVPHGRAAAIGLRASLPWNISHNATAFADVAAVMGGPREASALPPLFADFCDAVGLETSLANDLPGLTADLLAAEMAAPEHAAMRRSNAKPTTDADLLHLAKVVLGSVHAGP